MTKPREDAPLPAPTRGRWRARFRALLPWEAPHRVTLALLFGLLVLGGVAFWQVCRMESVELQQMMEKDGRREEERYRTTVEKITRLELEQAREQKRLAALELKMALEALMRRSITSPISGVVLDRFMSPGEVVEDQKILTVAQIDPLRVEVILPASRFGSIVVGTRARRARRRHQGEGREPRSR